MNWYLKVIKQYADFKGRARRKEFWMFTLINLIISTVLNAIDMSLGTIILGLIYSLFVLIPGIAVGARRLHDIGKSGWMLLVALIPVIGAIWLIVLFVQDSQPGSNEYGPNPKEIGQNPDNSVLDDGLRTE